jgi:hypothetical protein
LTCFSLWFAYQDGAHPCIGAAASF